MWPSPKAPQKIQSKKVWTSHWWKLRPRKPKDVHRSLHASLPNIGAQTASCRAFCLAAFPSLIWRWAAASIHCNTSTIPPTSWRCRFSRSVSALIHWISPFIVLMDFKTNEYRYGGSDDRTENSWGQSRDDIQVGVVLNSFEVLPKNLRKSMLWSVALDVVIQVFLDSSNLGFWQAVSTSYSSFAITLSFGSSLESIWTHWHTKCCFKATRPSLLDESEARSPSHVCSEEFSAKFSAKWNRSMAKWR